MNPKTLSVREGRARGLYDEQLQRLQQEKEIDRQEDDKPALFDDERLRDRDKD
jgi:hypothetical protein